MTGFGMQRSEVDRDVPIAIISEFKSRRTVVPRQRNGDGPKANGAIHLRLPTYRREPMNMRSTYQNIMAMPAKSWIDAATSALAGNPRMMFEVV